MSDTDPAILAKWRAEQEDIANQVISLPDGPAACSSNYQWLPIDIDDKLFGGMDISFGDNDSAVAVYVIMKNNEIVYQDHLFFHVTVPYVSSYLAFREIEPLVKLVKRQVKTHPEFTPHAILVDGNGIFHERRAGIACHLGVLTDIPTIGVAKKIYCMDGLTVDAVECGLQLQLKLLIEFCEEHHIGKTMQELNFIRGIVPIRPIRTGVDGEMCNKLDERNESRVNERIQFISNLCNGFSVPIVGENDEILASALIGHGGLIKGKGRKKACGTKNPIFISIGHKVSLENAIKICCGLSLARIPEPIRQADSIGRKLIKSKNAS